jgi:hypothetical protein
MVLISGPVSMYYLKKNKKRIYLFGDEHYSTDGVCNKKSVDIIYFLDKIFKNKEINKQNNNKNNKNKIDFYLESQYSDLEKYTKEKKMSFLNNIKYKVFGDLSHSYLLKIINYYKLKGCFMKKEKVCRNNYPNVNFHSADFRRSVKCKYTKMMEDYTNNIFFLLISLNYGSQINNFVSKLIKFDKYEKVKKYIILSLKCNTIKTQLKKCDNKFQSLINKYIKTQFKNYDLVYKNIYNENINAIIKGIKNKKKMFSISEMSFSIQSILGMVISMNSIVMDIYLLSKMFKEDKNLIFVYAGNAHIKNYVEFLQKYMNFKLISGGVARTKRCIEVKKLY